MNVKVTELQLADVVRLSDGAYMDATVKQITETEVTLLRCYVSACDFSTSSGVICTFGYEEIKFSLDYSRPLNRIQKAAPLR